MSAKAKQERDNAELKFVTLKLTIEDLCSSPAPTLQIVKKRREEARALWEKVQSRHLGYCKAV